MRYLAILLLTSCVLHDAEPPDHDKTPPSHEEPPTYPENPPPPAGTKRVFVTRGAYTGALTAVMGIPDGLAAGDAICQQRAKAAGLTGSYVAWLSSSTKDAIDRVTAQGPWQLVGGGVAFENRSQLYGEPLVQIDRDERGQWVSSVETLVWTGTRAGGGRDVDTCANWTTTQGRGRYGRDSIDFDWTDSWWTYCDRAHHLICFEN